MRFARFHSALVTAVAVAAALGGAPACAVAKDVLSGAEPGGPGALSELAFPIPPILGRIDPDTYRVGPGDAFAFRVSDLLEARVVRVNPEGAIFLPDVGAIPIAGLTLSEAEAKVRDLLRPFVRGRGLVFSLFAPRRFRVAVLGEVTAPGPVTLQAPARASEVIAAAGGVAPPGARRGIEIRRGADTLEVDLVRYERAGDDDANPLVFETDVLFVPAAGPRVWILGAVPHPERYDLAPGDRLSTLVRLSGGPLPEASVNDAVLERFVDSVRSERLPVALGAALRSPGSSEDVVLEEGDRLFLPARANWKRGALAYVEGEVARPGAYPIVEGVDRVGALIERAGGLTEFAEPSGGRIERSLPAAARDSSLLILSRDHEEILLERDREWARTLASAHAIVSTDLGALLTRGDSKHDVLLLDGDRIVIPRRTPFVSVQGEVRRPGAVPHEPGWRALDYVRAAGGTTRRARERHALVTVASSGLQVDAVEAGMLHPGDTVWVPARPKQTAWGTIRDVFSTAAQAATIFLVIREATR